MFKVDAQLVADPTMKQLLAEAHAHIKKEVAKRLEGVTCPHGDAAELDVQVEPDHVVIKGCCEEIERSARAAIGDMKISFTAE